MLEVIKEKSDWLVAIALAPSRFALRGFSALRYSFGAGAEEEFPIADIADDGADSLNFNTPSQKHLSFTIAVIYLSAQVARADGAVSKAEYLAFRDAFPLNSSICGKIRQLFAIACQSKTPALQHVSQIKEAFPQQKELFISLAERLFRIATADKPLARVEEKLLAKISHQLGLTPAEYSSLHDKYSRPLPPHAVLGVKKRSPRAIIKQRYYALMQRYHPDRMAGNQISPEVQMLLTLKTTEISEAYKKMTKRAA